MTAQLEYLNPPGLSPAQGLYSQLTAVKSGTLHLISGQLAVGAEGEVVGEHDFAKQFACVFDNLVSVLKSVGGDTHSIAKMTTFLVHAQDIPVFMELRKALFPKLFPDGVYPPNTLLVVDRLVKEEFLIEVEAIAII